MKLVLTVKVILITMINWLNTCGLLLLLNSSDHNHPTSPLLAEPPELSDEAILPTSLKFVAANAGGEWRTGRCAENPCWQQNSTERLRRELRKSTWSQKYFNPHIPLVQTLRLHYPQCNSQTVQSDSRVLCSLVAADSEVCRGLISSFLSKMFSSLWGENWLA